MSLIGDGRGVVGTDVGKGVVGTDVGGDGQGVPIELPVVTSQPVVTWLERAWTAAGTSEQNLFDFNRWQGWRLSSRGV